MNRWWICALALSGCSAGPTLYVGKAPEPAPISDAGASDARSDADDDDDDDDDDHVLCTSAAECAQLPDTPYCSSERDRCVECLEDRHCKSDELCNEGDCEDER